MPRFRVVHELTKLECHINGISVVAQNMLPGFQTRKDLKLEWAGYLDLLDIDGKFSLVLNPSEAENLARRILHALGDNNGRQ